MGEVILLQAQDDLAAMQSSWESQDEPWATVLQFPAQPVAEAPVTVDEEEYGGSLRAKRALGWIAIHGQRNTPEGRDMYTAEYDDWRSGLGEMLRTAEDLRLLVEVDREKVHQIKGERVLASDNTTYMDNLVESGAASSRAAAEAAANSGDDMKARVMEMQARRDESDVWNVHRVNDIAAGRIMGSGRSVNRRTVVSMYPEESMNSDGDKPWEDLKYLRGLAYIQDYYFDGQQLHASTYSIGFADKKKLRLFLNDIGFAIPEEAHTSEWVRYGREEAINVGVSSLPRQIREGYYKSIGKAAPRFSTETLMDSREEFVERAFEELNIPLSASIASGKKQVAIHQFAEQLLAIGGSLSSEVVRGLMRICSRNKFDERDGRLMDELIRYSVAEDLRSYVLGIAPAGESESLPNTPVSVNPQAFIQQMGSKVAEGAQAGRSYGGCPGKMLRIGRRNAGDPAEVEDSQDAFGGKDIDGSAEADESQRLPAQIRCIKCRETSPKEKVVHKDYWCCPKCDYKIDICTGEPLHASKVDAQRESVTPSAGAVILEFIQMNRKKESPAAA